MKIVIIGANGQLGCDLARVLKKDKPICLTHRDVEISDYASASRVFVKYAPELVINTASFHNVPLCEKEDLKAFAVNALGARHLAENCLKFNSILVHISTDYVFDGKKNTPYSEQDLPNPLNVYGITKLAGENYIKSTMRRFFIIRTSALYGINKCRAKGGNFVDTMLRLHNEKNEIKVVGDQVIAHTYSLDLADKIKRLIQTDYFGLFHITNSGACSWLDFAESIFEILRLDVKIKKISSKEANSSVTRPQYSVLKNARLEELKLGCLRHWKEALRDYLLERKRLNLV